MDGVLTIAINGQEVKPTFNFPATEGGWLVAAVRPREEWPNDTHSLVRGLIWVCKTRIADFVDPDNFMAAGEERQIALGLPETLVDFGETVEVNLEGDCYYDVFCIGYRADGTGHLMGGGRYATGDVERVPGPLTFDQTKLFALAALGPSCAAGAGPKVTIRCLSCWNAKGRLSLVEFDFGADPPPPPVVCTRWQRVTRRQPPQPAPPQRYAIQVDHLGGVTPVGSRSLADVRKFITATA